MKIAVIGLGGVGGYLAANFARADLDVIGFGRGEHLKSIQKNGIKIIEDDNIYNTELDARELKDLSIFSQKPFDVVLFCVKSYDLVEAVQKIFPFMNEKTIVVSFSNGVSNGDNLQKMTKSIVLDGCMYILSHIEKSGVIKKEGKVFAAVFGGEDEEAIEKLAQVFQSSNLRYKTPKDIKTAIWKKYIFISAFATATSFFNKSIARVYKENKDMMEVLLDEIAQVAHAKNIDIFDEIPKSLEIASKLLADASTSMHLDFQNKKQVELESLSAYVVKEALISGVKTPLMDKMYKYLDKVASKF